jgi:hypothetical protein
MNLVNQVMENLSGESLDKLSALLGSDSESTETAARAAVPSLLAGLAGLASQESGAKKLTSALGGLDDGMLGNVFQLLSGDTNALMEKGGGLLSGLFGDGLINGLANAVARYSGFNIATVKKLLSYLAPVILGSVAKQWRSRGATAGALTNLFAEQKQNIQDSMPAGFEMPSVPGLERVGATARATGRAAENASRSAASWAVPLALALLAAYLIWSFMQPRQVANPANDAELERTTAMKPVVPDMPAAHDAADLTGHLTEFAESATDTFAGITDATSAAAAMPQLKELSTQLDAARESFGNLPEAGRAAIRTFANQHFGDLLKKIDAVNLIPGLPAEVKMLINQIVDKIREFGTAQRTAT